MATIEREGSPDPETLLAWFRRMLEIRAFENRVQELFFDGLIQGTTHLCQGQEGVAVGATAALGPEDYVTVTYRGHGQSLARGMSPVAAFAELMGKATGCSRGMGGSMHLAQADLGLLGSFAIVGAGLPVAVGAALSAKLQGTDRVAISFCGDGATNIGTFHEACNMAAVWKAPAVFVIENNLYGEYSPLAETTAVADLAARAAAYAMPSEIVDGQDPTAVHAAVARAVARARAGGGPTLIEAKTYRYRGHSRTDPASYRPPGELDAWLARDPITIVRKQLIASGVLDEAAADAIESEVEAAIDEAAAEALAAPVLSIEDARRLVEAPESPRIADTGVEQPPAELTYRAAITAALEDSLEADGRVVLFGEDVASSGGVFKTTVGLAERFGPSRVFNTPICENGFLGVALGMAVTGLRPVVEIMFSDFLAMGADAIVNEIAKFHFLSGGQFSVPLTIRAAGGASGRFGAQHSATAESWFLAQPGLHVVTISNPASAYRVLREAIDENGPTLVIEHKALYERSGQVSRVTGAFARGERRATVDRPGRDLTVVATLLMAERARRAAELATEVGVDAEVIDLTWLRPLDVATVVEHLAATRRLLVVEEQVHAAGWGATLISELARRGLPLAVPPVVVGFGDDVLVPYSPTLEDAVLPSVERIAEAIHEVARAEAQ